MNKSYSPGDENDPAMELIHIFDQTIDQRNRAFQLLTRYLRTHQRTGPGSVIMECGCLVCEETRLLLVGMVKEE